MAGDWIKVEHATPSKPEIYKLARLLSVSRGDAFLLAFDWWVWLDRNSCNGNVTQLLRSDIDELMHCPGFSAAMEAVDWLNFPADGVANVPHFDRHNGKTAKNRALTKMRVEAYRASERNAAIVTDALPEKRREEKREVQKRKVDAPPDGVAAPTPAGLNGHDPGKKATRLLADWRLPEQWKQWAMDAHGLDAQRVVRIGLDFRDYWIAKPGREGTKLDWGATWRRWVRRACGDA